MDKERHHIQITYSDELVECCIEVAGHDVFTPVKPSDVRVGTMRVNELMKELSNILREPVNQWIHIQLGLRLYDGPRIYIYKTPRLIDWTQTQAVDDAADIIGDLVRNR